MLICQIYDLIQLSVMKICKKVHLININSIDTLLKSLQYLHQQQIRLCEDRGQTLTSQILYNLYLMEQRQEKMLPDNQFTFLPFGFAHFNVPFTFGFTNIPEAQPQLLGSNHHILSNSSQKLGKEQSIQYFKSFFSPKETAKSLQRRNQNLEMLSFQISDEEPDDIYNRRKQKVNDLMKQEKQQVQSILAIRQQSETKFDAIIEFIKFFCVLKQSLQGVRTDYYSTKTFCALKNASEQELLNATRVVKKMYNNITKYPSKMKEVLGHPQSQQTEIQRRTLEFLIIPRFLISREKINRLVRDEDLQRNFQYLIANQCLGHYNNEANKKMPEESHMKYVRQLLEKNGGREKFKKICSINHGNKFLKCFPAAYYTLYSQSLNYLQYLDNGLKSGKKFESIRKDLEKMAKQSEETVGNSSLTENESSNNIYSLKSLGQCLNKIENEDRNHGKDEREESNKVQTQNNEIIMVKKMMSTPIGELPKQVPEQRRFNVRKFKTMQQNLEQNIILVSPPNYSQI